MYLQNWQIKAAAILGHGQMDMVFVHVFPFHGEGFGLSQPGEQKPFIKHPMDRVIERVNLLPPGDQVFDNCSASPLIQAICG